MSINKEEVIHIAKLSSINLSNEEVSKYAKDLEEILEFANIINNINTDDVRETIATNGAYNVFRKDEIKQIISKEELLKNAPSKEEGMFRIPKVIN